MQQIGFLLQILLSAQHVSDTIMPIIRSSRVIQMVAACSSWRFGLQVVGLLWSCGLCVRFVRSNKPYSQRFSKDLSDFKTPLTAYGTSDIP